MASVFVRSVLKVCVAQICQNMGWNAVQATPLDLLVDILHRYLEELAKTCHRYTEQFGRTEPNLDDLGLAFKDIGIPLGELEDFINNVEPVPFVHPLPLFPVPRPNNLQIPKEGSREVAQRPEWIHEFLPLMYPEAEEEEYVSSPLTSVDGMMRNSIGNNEGATSIDSPRVSLKRPLDIEAMMQTPKRARLWTEDEGRPMREMTSVVMTSQGVIFSPMQEGKLPDARTPSKIQGDDSRPSSPSTPISSVSEAKKDVKKEPKKDIKKDSKKEDKKFKDRKDKKDLKKKDGKKDKKENKENKKKDKGKGKPKESLESKDTKSKSSVKMPHHMSKGVHIECKVKKIVPGKSLHSKSSKIKINKIKPTKLKQNKLKPFLTKSSKNKGNKFGETLKLLKTKPKKKSHLIHISAPVRLIPKSPVRAKSPKQEKPSPPIQLPPVLPKCPPIIQEKEREIISPTPLEPPMESIEKVIPRIQTPEPFSPEDSPERLVIDDNPETIARQERESRMQALNDSIDAAIQRGMEEAKREEQEACRKEQESNRTVDETIDEVVRMSSLKVKTEPRDIYEFTDDESSPPATPATPRTPEVTSPMKKKVKKESPEVSGKRVKEKIKEKIKQKSKDPKSKSRSPGANVAKVVVKSEPVEEPERPKTPEPHPGSSDQESPVSFPNPFSRPPGFSRYSAHLPYFSQFRQIPPALLPYPTSSPFSPQFSQQFQPHAPPNMPMPPIGFYVRTPKNDNVSVKNSTAPNPGTPNTFAAAISAAEKAEDLAFKIKQEKPEEVPSFPEKLEKAKSKEHKKEKKEKEKEKDKKEKDKEKEKPKTKKKKEKAKEKEKKNPEKEKMKPKIKEKEKTIKDKGKDKEKAKSIKKEKEKKKEKKEEKNKDEKESGGSPNASGIPKITVKFGNSSAQEVPKIVIKPMKAQEESRSPSPVKESTSPPPLSTQKSHPKPQIKVNPVPPAPKPTPGPASQSSAPACTVITETVGTIIDEEGNKIWICPACTRPDDGSPMIGCDECDDWYHWVCMGIVVPPKEEENWFCTRCITKKQSMQKKKKKKHRKDKTPL